MNTPFLVFFYYYTEFFGLSQMNEPENVYWQASNGVLPLHMFYSKISNNSIFVILFLVSSNSDSIFSICEVHPSFVQAFVSKEIFSFPVVNSYSNLINLLIIVVLLIHVKLTG